MDEQETHSEDDLDLGLDTEGDDVADTTATDTDEQETDSSDEHEQDTLELDSEVEANEKVKGKAEAARDKQVDAWVGKISSGEKSIDDLPSNLQWLKPHVQAKLGDEMPDLDELVEKKFTEREALKQFDSLQSELQDMGLSKAQKSSLVEKFKSFKSRGLSKLDALQTACEALSINPQEAYLDAKRQAMKLRTPGRFKKADATDIAALHDEAGYGEVSKNVPEDKKAEYLKKLLN